LKSGGLILKFLTKFAGVLAILAGSLTVAQAQQSRVYREGNSWVEERTGTISAAKNLRVRVAVGSVRVQGGASAISYVIRSRVQTGSEESARKMFEQYRINAGSRGDSAWITGEWPGRGPRKFSGELILEVPREMETVKIETQCGDVEVKNIAGTVDGQSGGGNVVFDAIGGTVTMETGGGNVWIGHTSAGVQVTTGGGNIDLGEIGGAVSIDTGGGHVHLQSATGAFKAETGAGDITAQKCSSSVHVETGGGNIEIGDAGGEVEMESGGGRLKLASARGMVHAETGSGRIELGRISGGVKAETGAGGIVVEIAADSNFVDSELESPAGDVVVYLSPQLAAVIRGSIDAASGHTIISEFPEIRVTTEGGEWSAKTVFAEGRLNGGGPVLKVKTSTGNIEFRRLTH
jgi:DUF4097 and DUF4098 domain-containing protein YvlB